MPRDTEKCPLSELTGVRIRRVKFRNCPLYTGENNSVKVKKEKKHAQFPRVVVSVIRDFYFMSLYL